MQLSDISLVNPWYLLNNPDGTGAASGEWHPGGRTATLNFLVYWSDLESFLSQCAGYPTSYGAGGGASIVQQIPLTYPYNRMLYAQRITHRACTVDAQKTPISNANPFTKAMVTVEFGSFPYPLGDGSSPFMQISAKGSTEFMTLPGVAFSFAGTGEKIEQDVGRIVGVQAFSITRFQLPDFDQWLGVSLPLLGSVNADTVTISKSTFAPGCLLFPTQDLSSQTNVLGSPQVQASFDVVFRTVNWNAGMRSDGVYDTLVPAPYPTNPLAPLFQ
jgi:hypothetical protein